MADDNEHRDVAKTTNTILAFTMLFLQNTIKDDIKCAQKDDVKSKNRPL
jgi:hypothetical protein